MTENSGGGKAELEEEEEEEEEEEGLKGLRLYGIVVD